MSRRNLILILIVLGFAFLLIVRPQSPKNGVITPADTPAETSPTNRLDDGSPTPTPAPQPTSSSGATPTPNPAEPASSVSPEIAAKFDSARVQALNSIPTQSDLQKLNAEQVHFTPPAVINAAVEIAKLSDLIDKNPGLSEKGLAFYKECAENEASSTTARASCLVEFDDLKAKSSSKIPQPAVDARLRALAAKTRR